MAKTRMICAGNWKLNKTPEEAEGFLKQLGEAVSAEQLKDFAVFLPSYNLYTVKSAGVSVPFGPQNIYWENSGAYTGETSPEVVAGMGCQLALIGHSERRQLFHETNEETAKKVNSAFVNNLTPVLCVGETLEQREKGETNQIIEEQLKVAISELKPSDDLWVAYEPVWAIGTGKVATPEQAEEAHLHLKSVMTELKGAEFAEKTPVLYGGSVKPENALQLAEKPSIDGFLIGGASLKVESFVEIYTQSQKALN